jgi:hypothetical protein
MRNMSFDEVKHLINDKKHSIDYEVNKFRAQTNQEGWHMKRMRPRHEDEIQALNRLCRKKIQDAMKSGEMIYEPESRVFIIEKYYKGERGVAKAKG